MDKIENIAERIRASFEIRTLAATALGPTRTLIRHCSHAIGQSTDEQRQ
jgi:hypothetical protein